MRLWTNPHLVIEAKTLLEGVIRGSTDEQSAQQKGLMYDNTETMEDDAEKVTSDLKTDTRTAGYQSPT